ncbi:flagellar hook-length control protein FliK [Chitinimonas taiwanensis]|uniref:Hook-length control protein FliK n=1 Tax=Chitinimonas taiwanensis DSM 18899 TaxID=1121279 RepID=A0A1K2HLS9_9NEIS|nr:flagellar hook-length control protein FliK [Chitinimonas taiwanensis]SFZ77521.1 hook-length control protein FliK [Chitinimonas taiwanensis DSM 18899]
MIPANALVPPLQAQVKTAETPLIQVVNAVQEVQRLFTIGEQVRAQVTGLLPNGRYAVLVKDQLLDLNLPRNTEESAAFDMQVIANSPRLTFLLPRQLLSAPQATPNPPSPDRSSNVALSGTARFLGDLLAELAGQPDQPAKANATQASATLLSSAEQVLDTRKLTETLKQAISAGGLFYESHLAEWVKGERSLEQLLKEPLAKLLTQTSAEQAGKPADRGGADGASQLRQGIEARLSGLLAGRPEMEQRSEDATRQATAASLEALSQDLEPMPASARQMVQQQLQLLDQRQLAWQGQVWPGQEMRWEVEEDGANRYSEEGEQARVWRTRVQMNLPKLGSVDVLLTLYDRSRLEVGFQVVQAQTAERIRAEQGRLQLQLEAAGLALQANQVVIVAEDN